MVVCAPRMPALADLDLNLLVALEALLAEANVTRAAAALGVTQPTMSRSLQRLRAHFGDDLLVRSGRGLVRTERGERLQARVRHSLAALRRVLADDDEFDPAAGARSFHVAAPDVLGVWLLPAFVGRLRAAAPHVDLTMHPMAPHEVAAQLDAGSLDVAFGATPRTGAGLMRRVVGRDPWVSLVRRGHPAVGERLDRATFVGLPHALASPAGAGPGAVDRALAAAGAARRVALRSAFFVSVAMAAAESDLVVTLPRTAGLRLARMLDLRAFAPPLVLEPVKIQAAWHERADAAPAHRWFRRELFACAAERLEGAPEAEPGAPVGA